MREKEPVTNVDARFSEPGAGPTPWSKARSALDGAEIFWLSSVRDDGRPHVTPLLGVWSKGALYFCTGPDEQKAKNLELNPSCVMTTGDSTLTGLDLVIEGAAARVADQSERRSVADRFEAKYGSQFSAPDGTWSGLGDAMRRGEVLLYQVVPSRAFGFRKGDEYSQTRWDFV